MYPSGVLYACTRSEALWRFKGETCGGSNLTLLGVGGGSSLSCVLLYFLRFRTDGFGGDSIEATELAVELSGMDSS